MKLPSQFYVLGIFLVFSCDVLHTLHKRTAWKAKLACSLISFLQHLPVNFRPWFSVQIIFFIFYFWLFVRQCLKQLLYSLSAFRRASCCMIFLKKHRANLARWHWLLCSLQALEKNMHAVCVVCSLILRNVCA